MEIDKISFENMRILGVSASFEELDVNGDGKISKDDISLTTDKKISSQIMQVLSFEDEDASLLEESPINKAGDTSDTTDTADTTDTTGTTGEYAKLQEQLTKLNEAMSALNEQIEAKEADNENLKKEKEVLEAQQKVKATELEQANNKLQQEENILNEYITEYTSNQEEIDTLNKQILSEQNREQSEYDSDIRKLTNQAIGAYNPENDGEDFNAYFAKKMDSMGFPVFTKLNSLNDEASSLSSSAKNILNNISHQSSVVYTAKSNATRISSELSVLNSAIEAKANSINANNTQIASLQSEINTKNTEKSKITAEIQKLVPGGGLTAKEVLSQISESEKNCAKELGWKLEDCYVAMGTKDGKFHIYPKSGGAGAVRAYYQRKSGDDYSDESLSCVSKGNGYIRSVADVTGSGAGSAVYQFSSVNCDWTDGEACCFAGCYQTCSPLSFDVNGDGIQTSNQTVSFDIDGDGVKDVVNNSAEWVLAFDKDHNGIAGEDGSELFGNNTDLDGDGKADGYQDGFEALKALAKKEGLISDTDNKLDEKDIKFLQEKYGLVMTQGYAGEAKSLSELGIMEINLAQTTNTKFERNFDGKNNDIMRQEGATFTVNGETREYADIWNAKKSAYEDTSLIEKRLKPEKENFTIESTQVNEIGIFSLNKDGVVALKGNVEFDAIKNHAKNSVVAPKDIPNEVVDEGDEKDKKDKNI